MRLHRQHSSSLLKRTTKTKVKLLDGKLTKGEGVARLQANSEKYTLSHEPVKIMVGRNWSRIMSPLPAISIARTKFQRFVRGIQYDPKYKAGKDDGMRSAIYTNGMFGTGLLPAVLYNFEQAGAKVEVTDERGKAPARKHNFQWIWKETLREDQKNCIEIMKTENVGIIRLPTGSGKSATSAYQIAKLGLTTLYCVPTKELMYQVAEDIPTQVSGLKIGLMGDGNSPASDCNVVIAIYKSLLQLHGKTDAEREAFSDAMSPFELLVCDECHAVASRDQITATWQTIMDIPAYYRYGFSATPYEITEQRGGTFAELLQHSAFGELIYDLSMEDAREKGYVTPFTAYFIKPRYSAAMVSQAKTSTTGKSYQEAYEDVIINNPTRNKAIIDAVGLMMKEKRKTMVVAQRIPHNDMLALMLAEKYGEDSVYQIHGQLESTDRRATVEAFKKDKSPCVIVSSSIANTGLNLPDVSCIINASAGTSAIQVIQRTGRGLRLADGKEDMILLDFADNALGYWFKRHTENRAKYYKELGADVEILE